MSTRRWLYQGMARLHQDEQGEVGIVQLVSIAVGVIILVGLFLFGKDLATWIGQKWGEIKGGQGGDFNPGK